MAYEHQTYDAILERLIARVEESYPDIDTREGSIIFNALAPAAMELALCYAEMDNVLDQSFVDTASRDYIFRACEQVGMDTSRFEATFGKFKGEFNVPVPIGSRWNYDLYNYTIEEEIESDNDYFAYSMTCETEGSEANYIIGTLTPITDSPENLDYAAVTGCLIEGEDESTDDEARAAYYEYLNTTASDGNVGQYEKWCDGYAGIGSYKIIPLWNGANTVKVSILTGNNRAASSELIADFQEYLDPGTTGMGDGVAPIGSFVTVTTPTEVPINVSFTAKLKEGVETAPTIDNVLTEYFSDIAYQKEVISYMSVGAVILDIDGIDYINDLKLNGGTTDITITGENIPVLGTVDWTVI